MRSSRRPARAGRPAASPRIMLDAALTALLRRLGGTPCFRVYGKGGPERAWRVIDVKIEGISLVSNYRDQFHEVLSHGGPEKLLAQLRERNSGLVPPGLLIPMVASAAVPADPVEGVSRLPLADAVRRKGANTES